MIRTTFCKVGLAFVCSIHAWGEEDNPYAGLKKLKESLAVPKQFESVHDFSPVTYLQMFTVDDINRFTKADGSLEPKQKTGLEKLFIESHKATVKKYGQSYPISSDAPLVKLLASVHPEIAKLSKEPDGSIYMVEIIRILHKKAKQ
jgi:hypothetical protein